MKKLSHSVKNTTGSTVDQETVPKNEEDNREDDLGEPPAKKKRNRGMNKNRPRAAKLDFNIQLCASIVREEKCGYGENCKYLHDVKQYLESKPPDIGDNCINFTKFGKCMYGVTCRFGKKHVSADFKNIVNTELFEKEASSVTQSALNKDLTFALRKKKYLFPKAERYLKQLALVRNEGRPYRELGNMEKLEVNASGAVTDEDLIRLRPCERKKVTRNLVFESVSA